MTYLDTYLGALLISNVCLVLLAHIVRALAIGMDESGTAKASFCCFLVKL